MIHPREIIIAPMLTEKSLLEKENHNRYMFKVRINANKIEIKKAIEKVFSVKVVKINTIRMKGKPKRMGKYEGRRPDWKKAIVTLQADHKIPDFEV